MPPGPRVLYVLGTRTSLGRTVRTACRGTPGGSISALLERVVGECGAGVSGVFEAEDGARTEPIQMSELVQGTIVHSDPSGGPLPHKQGGPLRVTFPEGVAVQASVCGTLTPTPTLTITITLALTLTLTPTLTLTRRACAARPSRSTSRARSG